jgi:hypothetical protein
MSRNFEIGKTYSTRSIGDHNCIISITVSSRTEKTIKVENGTKTLRVRVNSSGNEVVKPWGTYSMSPTIESCDTRTLRPDWEK